MRILFNRLTTLGNKSGVGQYASHLLSALRDRKGEHDIEGFPTGAPWLACRAQASLRAAYQRLRGNRLKLRRLWWLAPAGKLAQALGARACRLGRRWVQHHIATALAQGGFDLYHEPNFLPFESDVPTVLTLHDLSVLLYPEWHPPRRVEEFERRFLTAVKRADHIITVSGSIQREVTRVLNLPVTKVTAVYNGVGPQFAPLARSQTEEALRRHGLKPGYLLHVGTLEPRKNLLMLMRAYCGLPRPLRDRAPLLLVGAWGWQDRAIRDYFASNARHRGVRHLGYVPDRDVPAFYNGARALVCPSFYEGFGLPCMEMLACGGAVLASTADVFQETLGSHAQLLAPEDGDAWRAAMANIIQDDTCRNLLRKDSVAHAGAFTWDNAARATWRVYETVLGGTPSSARLRRAA